MPAYYLSVRRLADEDKTMTKLIQVHCFLKVITGDVTWSLPTADCGLWTDY